MNVSNQPKSSSRVEVSLAKRSQVKETQVSKMDNKDAKKQKDKKKKKDKTMKVHFKPRLPQYKPRQELRALLGQRLPLLPRDCYGPPPTAPVGLRRSERIKAKRLAMIAALFALLDVVCKGDPKSVQG
ncbi:uncharacterized protein SPSK_08123 [Sporothrix schenckii 1099-18]|uniref:Uncharacterized protein n=1 Tax=Sporothrix schenckii 1099-18 TaxID=1397361 RepID=A0A0F2MI67_SPOSC|nr:uncharacterized protein SPSK_08123 [Sporothrix schenckii 1099-18]KJR88525.1 hypothetical protein SPSK_08123 [Sporothrix schenckii 1099-18]